MDQIILKILSLSHNPNNNILVYWD